MAKNYAALANDVISALGGKENIVAVTHCMTRLRFVLKDETLTDAARLKSISGVLGVVRNGARSYTPLMPSAFFTRLAGKSDACAFQVQVSSIAARCPPAE